MKKVLTFSMLLVLGLVASQVLPGTLGERYPTFQAGATAFLYICLSYIMINVGREFEIDKKRRKSYLSIKDVSCLYLLSDETKNASSHMLLRGRDIGAQSAIP